MIDEIYLGLSYDDAFGHTALAIDDNIISINSFSKYFNMTGWRLGWMVVPDAMVPVVERLAQNLFICASTVSQMPAWPAFEPRALPNTNAAAPSSRPGATTSSRTAGTGPAVPVMPDGAFYAWADCTAACAWACRAAGTLPTR
jgi:aspartate/methionine/tyrosine aminotransferase